MRSLREEIARSRQTVNNDPFQYDEHEEVDVEMYANDSGTWSVKVSCTSDPSLSFPLQKFPDQASADHHARQCCDRIIRKKMNEVRVLIRSLILEGNNQGCNNHSLGWIDTKGTFHDITEHLETHDDWMDRYQATEMGVDRYPMGQIPDGWIKVSNANEFWFAARDWSDLSFEQFEGMVEAWSACKRYSKWLQNDVEGFYVTFGLSDPDPFGFTEHMEQYTIPEFIDKFVGRRGEDLFYGMLLGE